MKINKWLWFYFLIDIYLTFIIGCIYIAMQQNIRLSANDASLVSATEISQKLKDSTDISSVIPIEKIDLKNSLSPFVYVFNQNGDLVGTNVIQNDNKPIPPKGVLDYAASNGVNKVTWQPEAGVREAIVVLPYSHDNENGFIVAGHSLKEYESRIDNVGHLLSLLLLLGFAGNAIFAYLLAIIFDRKNGK